MRFSGLSPPISPVRHRPVQLLRRRVGIVASRDVTLPSGVEVQVTGVPAMLVLAVLQTIPEPKPPIIQLEGKERTEENPNDPEYLKKVQEYKVAQGRLTNEAYLANGVLKINKLPDDKIPLESDDWVERLEIVGVQPRKVGLGRRIDWLQYHILGDGDLSELITAIALAGGGVTEELVKQAADSFRPIENGTAPIDLSTAAAIRQRDQAGDNTWPSQ